MRDILYDILTGQEMFVGDMLVDERNELFELVKIIWTTDGGEVVVKECSDLNRAYRADHFGCIVKRIGERLEDKPDVQVTDLGSIKKDA